MPPAFAGATPKASGDRSSRTLANKMKALPTIIASIILVLLLVSLLFPAVRIGPESGGRAQAKNDVTQLVMAAKAYISEYGKPPEGDPQAIIRSLLGENPRKIVFMELQSKQLSKEGLFIDPWCTPYIFDLSKPSGSWAYSFGKNKRDEKGKGDDCTSWQ